MAAQPDGTPARADASWAGWASLEPYALDWDGQAAGVRSRGLEVENVACGGSWRAPALSITNLHAELSRGRVDAHGGLDVATRALGVSVASDVDPHAVAPALTEEARRALAELSWPQPPGLKGDVSLVLPSWTNRQPDWRAEVQPTLRLAGELKLERGGAYRGVQVSAVQTHVAYSNRVWRLPDLMVLRPEGTLEAAVEASEETGDFHARISSTLDPGMVRPVLDEKQRKALDLLTCAEPPAIGVEVWGRGQDPERIGLKGRVALTNFTFRGQSASGLQTGFQYTNRFLQLSSPRAQRGNQQMSADGLGADFAAQLIYLTNGFSTAEPMFVARAIGAHVARAIEAYQFKQPPIAHVYGIIPMHGEDQADLHFDLDGGPFEWWRFHVARVVGHVHWLGQQVTLSNMWMDFYGGQAAGSAHFDFIPHEDTRYQFAVTATNALAGPLTKDLFAVTNRMDGRLSGMLVVTNASTANLQTWNGYGDVQPARRVHLGDPHLRHLFGRAEHHGAGGGQQPGHGGHLHLRDHQWRHPLRGYGYSLDGDAFGLPRHAGF